MAFFHKLKSATQHKALRILSRVFGRYKALQIEYRIFRRRALAHLRAMDRLLPEAPPMSVPYTREQLAALDRKVLGKLRFLQYHSLSYENARFLIVGPAAGSGGGSSLLAMTTKGLKLGYLYDRTVLYDDRDLHYDFCFKPIGVHSLGKAGSKAGEPARFNFLEQKERAVHLVPWTSMAWGVEVETDLIIKYGFRLSEIYYGPPPKYLPFSHLYIDGLLMDSFLELKEEYRVHIEERRRELGLASPTIGLHIRQGDVAQGTNPAMHYRNHPVTNYFQAIERVASEADIKTVFVTSDSEKAIRNLPKDSGIDFIHDDREKRYDNLNYRMVREKPELAKQETMTVIKNIYLLADCDYIVGVYGHFVKYGMALSYYRNKKLNGILIRKKGETGFDLEYYTTDDDRLPASTAPVLPYTPSLRERGGLPWPR